MPLGAEGEGAELARVREASSDRALHLFSHIMYLCERHWGNREEES